MSFQLAYGSGWVVVKIVPLCTCVRIPVVFFSSSSLRQRGAVLTLPFAPTFFLCLSVCLSARSPVCLSTFPACLPACLANGFLPGRDLKTMTMLKLYEDFGLDENTQSFTGHAMALQRDDSYLNKWVSSTMPPCHSLFDLQSRRVDGRRKGWSVLAIKTKARAAVGRGRQTVDPSYDYHGGQWLIRVTTVCGTPKPMYLMLPFFYDNNNIWPYVLCGPP